MQIMNKDIIHQSFLISLQRISKEVIVYGKNKNNEKYFIKRIDDKSYIKTKFRLIIEEVYQYESDSPDDIDRIIDRYVNYT